MALIQHASIRLKNKIYGRKEDQTAVLILDPTEAQPPPLPFIPSVANYMLHSKPMSPAMGKELHQRQGTGSSDVHNGVWQHHTLEPRKPGKGLTLRLTYTCFTFPLCGFFTIIQPVLAVLSFFTWSILELLFSISLSTGECCCSTASRTVRTAASMGSCLSFRYLKAN